MLIQHPTTASLCWTRPAFREVLRSARSSLRLRHQGPRPPLKWDIMPVFLGLLSQGPPSPVSLTPRRLRGSIYLLVRFKHGLNILFCSHDVGDCRRLFLRPRCVNLTWSCSTSSFGLPQAVALGDSSNKAPSENIAAKSPASPTSAAFVNEPGASVTSTTAIPKQKPAKVVLTIPLHAR